MNFRSKYYILNTKFQIYMNKFFYSYFFFFKVIIYFFQWGPENDLTAIDLIFKKKDLKALKIFLEAYTFLKNPNYEDEDKEELEK